jgi:hypothetical protein
MEVQQQTTIFATSFQTILFCNFQACMLSETCQCLVSLCCYLGWRIDNSSLSNFTLCRNTTLRCLCSKQFPRSVSSSRNIFYCFALYYLNDVYKLQINISCWCEIIHFRVIICVPVDMSRLPRSIHAFDLLRQSIYYRLFPCSILKSAYIIYAIES